MQWCNLWFTDKLTQRLTSIMRLLYRGLSVASVRIRSISLRRIFLALMLLYLLLIRVDPGKRSAGHFYAMHPQWLLSLMIFFLLFLHSQLFPQLSHGCSACMDSFSRRGTPCLDLITEPTAGDRVLMELSWN